MNEDKARILAARWIDSWNRHDLELILSHYTDDVVLFSPVAARLLQDPSGEVRGKAALRTISARVSTYSRI